MRAVIASCVLVVFGFGAVVADDFFFTTTKIEKKGDSFVITGAKKKAKKDDDAPKEMSFTIAATTKVFKGKGMFDKDTKKFTVETGDAIEKGLSDDMFSKVSTDTPVNLYLTTEADKVTKVVYMAKKKKKAE